MSYTVKLAIFPAWKAPCPYETLDATFGAINDAVAAGKQNLAAITEQELTTVASTTSPRSILHSTGSSEEGGLVAIDMSLIEVHGLLVFDNSGIEVANWTTWDEAVDRASIGQN